MIRVLVLYPQAPEPGRYEQHIELSRREVPDATIRHGRIFGAPQGKPDFEYFCEFEFVDRDVFKAAGNGLMASAADAQQLGVPFQTCFADVE